MITEASDTFQSAEWRGRVRAALVLATWADAFAAGPDPAGSTGHDRPTWTLSARPGTRIRSMWALAEHLARHGGAVVPADLGRALVGQKAPGPTRDPRSPGATASRVPPARSWSGTSMASRGLTSRSGVISTVPVGLVPGIALTAVAQRARRAAALTRPHPWALDVAAAQAVAVAVAARTSGGPVDAHTVITRITKPLGAPGLRAVLRRVPPLIRHSASPQRAAMQLRAHPAEVSTVPVALTAFLLHPDDPVAAVRFAARTGGDVRAVAAMTGAVCGAYYGERALPRPDAIPTDLIRVADALAGCGGIRDSAVTSG